MKNTIIATRQISLLVTYRVPLNSDVSWRTVSTPIHLKVDDTNTALFVTSPSNEVEVPLYGAEAARRGIRQLDVFDQFDALLRGFPFPVRSEVCAAIRGATRIIAPQLVASAQPNYPSLVTP